MITYGGNRKEGVGLQKRVDAIVDVIVHVVI